jgi:hypothetical protein
MSLSPSLLNLPSFKILDQKMPLLNSSNRLSKDYLILTIILLIHLIILGINANQVDSSSVESRKPTETASRWNFLGFIKHIIKKQPPDPKQKFIQSKINKIETDKNINVTKNILVGSFVGGNRLTYIYCRAMCSVLKSFVLCRIKSP